MARCLILAFALLSIVPVAAADPVCVGPTCAFVMPSDGACAFGPMGGACVADVEYGNTPVCPQPATGYHGFTGVEAWVPAGAHVVVGAADTRCDPPFYGNHRVEGAFVVVDTWGALPSSWTFVGWQHADTVNGPYCVAQAHHGDSLLVNFASFGVDCPAGAYPDAAWGALLP